MKVIVVGAGVAGTAIAIGLRRIGAEVTVYEASPDSAGPEGSFLSLASNGLRALEALGCLESIRGSGFDVSWQRMWSSSGRLLGEVPRGRLNGDSMLSVTLRRADLVAQLRAEAERAGARIVTGRRLTGAAVTGSSVQAEFDAGPADQADLLVGADGIWSSTRRLLDPGAPRPVYAGIWSVSGISEGFGGAVDGTFAPGVFNMVYGRRGVFLHLTADDGRIWWSAQVSGPAPSDEEAGLPSLLELFRSELTPSAVLRAATELQPATLEHVLAPVPVWHNSRIVLAGDAAHPVGSGQGASMSLEDAVELTARLAAPAGASVPLETALAGHVEARRARTAKMVRTASANRDAKTAGPIGRRTQTLLMPIVFRHFHAKATAWLYTDPAPSLPAMPSSPVTPAS